MTDVLIIIASTRSVRVGGAVGQWVEARVAASAGLEARIVDLRELDLPMMDEPKHPRLKDYTRQTTWQWSATVEAADAIVLVMPEYNHSFTAPLKNAIDYLHAEWAGKPIGMVSYGGISAGSRAVVALQPVLVNLGARLLPANVELAWVAESIADGEFVATDRQDRAIAGMLAALAELAG